MGWVSECRVEGSRIYCFTEAPPSAQAAGEASLRPFAVSALEATQGQMDGFFSRPPYKCHFEEVASVGDLLSICPQLDSRVASQKCEAVPRRARIQGS